jgi:hypothetical protein|tara:strand:- start:215 stop:358 length:144 start_codon:yes stop_codon:yes gene_type:complete
MDSPNQIEQKQDKHSPAPPFPGPDKKGAYNAVFARVGQYSSPFPVPN